jgi:Mannosyltransferase (PIG-V)
VSANASIPRPLTAGYDPDPVRARPRTALQLFVWSRLVIWVIATSTLVLLPGSLNVERYRWDRPRLHDLGPIVDVWARWDSDWYLQIAQHGYAWPSARPAFFPLYPLLVGGLGRLLGDHDVLAGLLVSLAAGAGAFVLFFRLAELKLGRSGAVRATFLLAIFPTTLFFGAVYGESLFLILSVAAFLLAEQGRFRAAAVAAGLAALTRPVGLALFPALAILAWQAPTRSRALRDLAVAPALFALYPLALWIWLGRPLAFLTAQSGIWRRHLSPYGPLGGFVEAIQQGAAKDFAVAVLLVALAAVAWKRLGTAYGAYAAASLALPLMWPSDSHALWSIARFGVVLFPVVFALETLTHRKWIMVAVTLGLTAWCVDSVVKWALWYWVA